MRPVYVPLFLSFGLAACQSNVPFEPVSDQCNSLQYLSMVGAKEDAIKAGTFPQGARIIRPGTAVTQDYRPDRLNVHINNKGRIERIACG